MRHTITTPDSIHPIPIGTWARSAKTGAVGQVVGWHIRSGCEEGPAAVSFEGCEHPVFMYDLLIDGTTHFYGPDTLERVEAPMTQQDTNDLQAESERELARHLEKYDAIAQPDPWNVEGTPTTADMLDVVAAAKAEVTDIQAEADEALKAHVDKYQEARAQLAGAVAVINADSDALIVAKRKRAGAVKREAMYRKRWQVAAARLHTARHNAKTAQSVINFQASEIAKLQWDTLAAELNYTEWQKASAQVARLEADFASKHAGEVTDTSEAVAVSLDLALMRSDLLQANKRIRDLEGENTTLKAAQSRNARRMTTDTLDSPRKTPAEVSDSVALRDQMTEFMAVLREYGYVAYENETRVKPEVWLKRKLANVGEPIEGKSSKPAAS